MVSEISFSNLEYIEEQYQKYQHHPETVEPTWRSFFEGWEMGRQGTGGVSKDLQVDRLINAYRTYGHLKASINPLVPAPPQQVPELSLKELGFHKTDLDQMFPTCGFLPEPEAPLQHLVDALEKTYSSSVGIEFMGLRMPELEKWLEKAIEPGFPIPFSPEEKLEIFHALNRAELFERFLHTKYVGQKRFSLEGAETLIPMLSFIIEEAAGSGVKDVVLGTTHRGRLNILANILRKSYETLFYEFEAHYVPDLSEGTGDVKYHKGFVGALQTQHGDPITITLSANPSHLESVDPVVMGQARAMQEKQGKAAVLPILIHGDAALAGQGVVYETLQLSNLRGYETGGTLHIVVNNQIGFTTLPKDGRSTRYCTDIAYAFGAPVFHINVEKPEESVFAALLALRIRQKFHCDVFLDLNCYRRWGHNEGDEPAFTQPLEYQTIRHKKTVREIYLDRLVQEGVLQTSQISQLEQEFQKQLQSALERPLVAAPPSKPLPSENLFQEYPTAVSETILRELARDFCSVPDDFHLHPKVKRLFQERLAMMDQGIDWGMAEHLAYASLLAQEIPIRISGQDVRRGTFSHRHAILVDQEQEGRRYAPLSHLKQKQAPFEIFNSPLSEFAVLGFDFGYSLLDSKGLVIWEAQFGDFANGGQVIIDQYICSSQQKWGHTSRLVLLLPHGYEGQGPEHSSARLERYLQLSAESNWYIVNCSSPSQLFHVLRRQLFLKQRKPLVIFTPKALLRHPTFVSPLQAFTQGTFQEFFDDTMERPRRVLLCSGKVYYDLVAERKSSDIAILRIDQLYPFHTEKFQTLVTKYQQTSEWFWVQEEPQNMGAFCYLFPILQKIVGKEIHYCGRGPSASTAAGSFALHKKEYDQWMQEAFA